MLEKLKCQTCTNIYEVLWDYTNDDSDDDYIDIDEFQDKVSDEDIEIFEEPVFCPFCGTYSAFVE